MKTLGIVISTPGRQSLGRTLTSILGQRTNVEDVLVVGDGHDDATADLVQFYHKLGLPCRYQATVKTRDWGHTQINYGLQHVRGDYVTYQDDDDIYLPRAIEEMVRLVNEFTEPRPLLGRVKTPELGLLWQRPNVTSVLDGHCLVAPNDKKKLGWMSSDHHGDQCFLHTTLRHYPEWAWTDRIWTLTRPSWPFDAWSCHRHENTWTWTLMHTDGPFAALLELRKDPDSDRMFAKNIWRDKPEFLTHVHLVGIAQFAVYACQGNDCWFQFDDENDPLIAALVEANYKEHTRTEYTHDWPPDFWKPLGQFDHVFDPATGEKLDDYRDDVWSGRPAS